MDPTVFHAAKNGELNTLQDLHRRDARSVSKAVTFQGNNVIHIAAREGYLEIVTWMLGLNSCLVLARNKNKNTPLHEAAESGNADVVEVLIQHSKCSASKRNLYGETPLIIASNHGHLQAARLLLNSTPLYMVFWPREDRRTCLNAAVYGGHLDVVKLILNEKPTCFNVVRVMLLIGDRFDTTPLHVAVHCGYVEIVREIIRTKLNLCWGMECWDNSLMTRKDNLGRCAVHIAAIKGHGEIIEEFMTVMPDCVEIRSVRLQTALHSAVESNQFHIVQKLLSKNKEDVNGKFVSYDCDIGGNTALHLAAMNGVDPQIARLLLSFPNVNLNAINDEGLTALDIANSKLKDSQHNPNFEAISALLEGEGATKSVIGHHNPNNNTPPGSRPYQSHSQNGSVESKILDVDTLVASLIAAVTFAAIFQVPGGLDDKKWEIAKWSLKPLFNVFLFSDCVALFGSLSVVIAWIFRERVQTKLVADRSILAKMSMLSLGISVVSTGLAFLSATILLTTPIDFNDEKNKNKRHEYKMVFAGEILTAFVAPSLALVFLSMAWLIEYYFKATNERQMRLKGELKKVMVSTLPVIAIVLVILFAYVIQNI